MTRRNRTSARFSLFAFQDIITAVTGVMVLVTLLLTLELVHRKQSSAPVRTEEITDQMTEASRAMSEVRIEAAEIEQLLKAIRKLAEEKKESASIVASNNVKELEKKSKAMVASEAELREEVRRIKGESETIKSQNEKVLEEVPDVQQEDLVELEKKLQQAKKQLARISKGKTLVYNLDPNEIRTVWFLQISGQNSLVAKFGSQEPPKVMDLGNFRAWVDGLSPSKDYFLVFLKPDGIKLFENIVQVLKDKAFDKYVDVLPDDINAIDPTNGTY